MLVPVFTKPLILGTALLSGAEDEDVGAEVVGLPSLDEFADAMLLVDPFNKSSTVTPVNSILVGTDAVELEVP